MCLICILNLEFCKINPRGDKIQSTCTWCSTKSMGFMTDCPSELNVFNCHFKSYIQFLLTASDCRYLLNVDKMHFSNRTKYLMLAEINHHRLVLNSLFTNKNR